MYFTSPPLRIQRAWRASSFRRGNLLVQGKSATANRQDGTVSPKSGQDPVMSTNVSPVRERTRRGAFQFPSSPARRAGCGLPTPSKLVDARMGRLMKK